MNLAKKNKHKDKKERLPYNIVKDSQNFIRVTVDGVSKKYNRIPKHLRSSLVIVLGIFAVLIIAIVANPTTTSETQPEVSQTAEPLSQLTEVIINEENQFQAQIPEIPTVSLKGDSISFSDQVQQATASSDQSSSTDQGRKETEEEVQTTMSVVGHPEQAKSVPQKSSSLDFQMIYPLRRQGAIVTKFGWYRHPLLEVWRYHQGVDIRCKKGDLVMAVASGEVTQVEENDAELVLVTIEHANGWKTIYGQLAEVTVQPGSHVVKGQQIGYTGQSQTAYEPHLHLEIHHMIEEENQAIDPGKFLP